MTQPLVAIIGAGPAGCALACFLKDLGIPSSVFDFGKRPELVVGESLIPAIVPLLNKLGIEKETRALGTLKPGASFFLTPENETTINFERDGPGLSAYSYNVPRKEFDALLLRAARRRHVPIIEEAAKLRADTVSNSLQLDDVSLELFKAALGGAPSLIVDATGRSRKLTKLLNIGETRGARLDTALFSHCEGIEMTYPGNIHINRLTAGWSWRIPLPGRTSVGVVIPPHRLNELGASAEEQYDSIFLNDPVLSRYTTNARRITHVAKYNNYQLISDRFFGSNWALVGDAAGFVDPIFSSGLQLALDGAHELAQAISALRVRRESISGERSIFVTTLPLQRYESRLRRKLRLWQRVVETFYTGRLFGLTRAARLYEDRFPWKFLIPGAEARLRRTLSGMIAPESLQFQASTWMLKSSIGDRFGERLAIK